MFTSGPGIDSGRSPAEDAVTLAKLREDLKRQDVGVQVMLKVVAQERPGLWRRDGRIDLSVDHKEARLAWAALWHRQDPVVGVITKDMLTGDPTKIHPREWVLAVRAYHDLIHTARSEASADDTPLLSPRILNDWCTKHYPQVWKSNRRKAAILIQEGLFHVGLPPLPLFFRMLKQYTSYRAGAITRDALAILNSGVSVGLAAISPSLETGPIESPDDIAKSSEVVASLQSVMHDKEVNTEDGESSELFKDEAPRPKPVPVPEPPKPAPSLPPSFQNLPPLPLPKPKELPPPPASAAQLYGPSVLEEEIQQEAELRAAATGEPAPRPKNPKPLSPERLTEVFAQAMTTASAADTVAPSPRKETAAKSVPVPTEEPDEEEEPEPEKEDEEEEAATVAPPAAGKKRIGRPRKATTPVTIPPRPPAVADIEQGLKSVVQQIEKCMGSPGVPMLGQRSTTSEQLGDVPQEHFIKEALEAVGDRAARELSAAQIAVELAIRSGDIVLGAIGLHLRQVIQDPSLFHIPEDGITMKYLGEMAKAVNAITSSMATAVDLSRKVGGEPDQTVLHGLLFLASNMTPQERIEYRLTHEVPARLLTGGGDSASALATSDAAESSRDAAEVEYLERRRKSVVDAEFTTAPDPASALPQTTLRELDDAVPRANVLDRFKSAGRSGG